MALYQNKRYNLLINFLQILKIFEENKFISTSKEIELLLCRFDKDKDGKITFNEFLEEILPYESFKQAKTD